MRVLNSLAVVFLLLAFVPSPAAIAGEADIDFYWTATGSARNVVDRAQIVLPDPEEEHRIEAAKMSLRG